MQSRAALLSLFLALILLCPLSSSLEPSDPCYVPETPTKLQVMLNTGTGMFDVQILQELYDEQTQTTSYEWFDPSLNVRAVIFVFLNSTDSAQNPAFPQDSSYIWKFTTDNTGYAEISPDAISLTEHIDENIPAQYTFVYCYKFNESARLANCLYLPGSNGQPLTEIDYISIPELNTIITPWDPCIPLQTNGASCGEFLLTLRSSFAGYTYEPPQGGADSGICIFIMLILALLLGAMFFRGQQPFSFFDFSSPHFDRGRKYQFRPKQMINQTAAAANAAVSMSGVSNVIGKIGKGIGKGAGAGLKKDVNGKRGGWGAAGKGLLEGSGITGAWNIVKKPFSKKKEPTAGDSKPSPEGKVNLVKQAANMVYRSQLLAPVRGVIGFGKGTAQLVRGVSIGSTSPKGKDSKEAIPQSSALPGLQGEYARSSGASGKGQAATLSAALGILELGRAFFMPAKEKDGKTNEKKKALIASAMQKLKSALWLGDTRTRAVSEKEYTEIRKKQADAELKTAEGKVSSAEKELKEAKQIEDLDRSPSRADRSGVEKAENELKQAKADLAVKKEALSNAENKIKELGSASAEKQKEASKKNRFVVEKLKGGKWETVGGFSTNVITGNTEISSHANVTNNAAYFAAVLSETVKYSPLVMGGFFQLGSYAGQKVIDSGGGKMELTGTGIDFGKGFAGTSSLFAGTMVTEKLQQTLTLDFMVRGTQTARNRVFYTSEKRRKDIDEAYSLESVNRLKQLTGKEKLDAKAEEILSKLSDPALQKGEKLLLEMQLAPHAAKLNLSLSRQKPAIEKELKQTLKDLKYKPPAVITTLSAQKEDLQSLQGKAEAKGDAERASKLNSAINSIDKLLLPKAQEQALKAMDLTMHDSYKALLKQTNSLFLEENSLKKELNSLNSKLKDAYSEMKYTPSEGASLEEQKTHAMEFAKTFVGPQPKDFEKNLKQAVETIDNIETASQKLKDISSESSRLSHMQSTFAGVSSPAALIQGQVVFSSALALKFIDEGIASNTDVLSAITATADAYASLSALGSIPSFANTKKEMDAFASSRDAQNIFPNETYYNTFKAEYDAGNYDNCSQFLSAPDVRSRNPSLSDKWNDLYSDYAASSLAGTKGGQDEINRFASLGYGAGITFQTSLRSSMLEYSAIEQGQSNLLENYNSLRDKIYTGEITNAVDLLNTSLNQQTALNSALAGEAAHNPAVLLHFSQDLAPGAEVLAPGAAFSSLASPYLSSSPEITLAGMLTADSAMLFSLLSSGASAEALTTHSSFSSLLAGTSKAAIDSEAYFKDASQMQEFPNFTGLQSQMTEQSTLISMYLDGKLPSSISTAGEEETKIASPASYSFDSLYSIITPMNLLPSTAESLERINQTLDKYTTGEASKEDLENAISQDKALGAAMRSLQKLEVWDDLTSGKGLNDAANQLTFAQASILIARWGEPVGTSAVKTLLSQDEEGHAILTLSKTPDGHFQIEGDYLHLPKPFTFEREDGSTYTSNKVSLSQINKDLYHLDDITPEVIERTAKPAISADINPNLQALAGAYNILTNSYFTNSEVQNTLERESINAFEKSELEKAQREMGGEVRKLNENKDEIYQTLTPDYYSKHTPSDAQTITEQTLSQTANTNTYMNYSETFSKASQTANIGDNYQITPIDIIKLAKEGIYPSPILMNEEEQAKWSQFQTKLSDILIKEGRERMPEYEYGVETQGMFYDEGKKVKAEKLAGYFGEEEIKETANLYSDSLKLMREEREEAGRIEAGKKYSEKIYENEKKNVDEEYTKKSNDLLLRKFEEKSTEEDLTKQLENLNNTSMVNIHNLHEEKRKRDDALRELARSYVQTKTPESQQQYQAYLQEIERKMNDLERIYTLGH